jgi:serine protease Do
MKALTDFFNVDYGGSLAQWKTFLADSSLLPEALKDTSINVDDGKRFNYDSSHIAFGYPSSLQTVSPDNMLAIGTGYYNGQGKTTLQVNVIQVHLNSTDPDRISIKRHVAPSPDLDDDFKQAWSKLLHKQHPYDGIAYNDGDEMDIATVIDTHASATPTELYTAFYGTQGTHTQDDMKAKLGMLTQSFKVKSP